MAQQDDIPDTEITEDQKLPEDNDTPFSDPDDMKSDIPEDSPRTDTGIEASQRYDEGLAGAAEADNSADIDIETGDKAG